MAFLGDLASAIFGSGPSSDPYAQQAAISRQQAEQDRQRVLQDQAQQQVLARYLQAAMLGQGPSVAQNQLQMGLEAQRRQQESMGAGISGPGAGLSRYLTATNVGNAGADMNQQASLLRAQEVAQARAQLGGVYQNMAGTSANLYSTGTSAGLGYSGQGMQVDQGNANRTMQQEGAILNGVGSGASLYFSRPPSTPGQN